MVSSVHVRRCSIPSVLRRVRVKSIHDKRAEAEARGAAREARSDSEQIAVLMNRGHGHCKEVTRLSTRIKEAKA